MTDLDILDAVNTELALEDQPTSILQDDLPPIYPVYLKVIVKEEDLKEEDLYCFEKKVFESFHDAWVWLNKHGKNIWACTNPTIHLEKYGRETPKPETLDRMRRYAKVILGGE